MRDRELTKVSSDFRCLTTKVRTKNLLPEATTPPPAEWNVPHDGPIDKSFSVTAGQFAKKVEKEEEDEEEEEEEEEEVYPKTIENFNWSNLGS